MRVDEGQPVLLDRMRPDPAQRIASRAEGAYVKGASSATAIREGTEKLIQSSLGKPSEAALKLLGQGGNRVDFFA